ncbi:NERD domain-containing protein [Francisella sp. Scap27]|uniref:nuclease-related domain-containing protein n=1 Tax=Francisella sp. Scap27 TaxID=2589986 RepID=UPI0015BF70EA|nr:NERD domain-containing protein [Francisella sp. Scap27]QLE78250.1 NERD domain-containing protein [Francisella sp. Scap27]
MNVGNLLLSILNTMFTYWYLWIIVLFILFCKTAFFKGWIGEKILAFSIKKIVEEKKGVLINNLMLPCDNGTTQIDHILLIPAGIFVIETKNMKGWIFGDAKSSNWTQQIYKHKSKFQNPIHQNYKHVKTIESTLNLDESLIKNIIVFVGSAVFKTKKPKNVFGLFKLRSFLKSQNSCNFTASEIKEYSNILNSTKLKNSIINNHKHVKSLTEKYKSVDTCPKCSSTLVERTVKKGERNGQTFLGCSNFPKCRYTKN